MRKLWEEGVPVPEPPATNRHAVDMELVDGFPLRQIKSVPDPRGLYSELLSLIVKLAGYGLIHGDFNEFNILIKEVEVEGEEAEGATAVEVEPSTDDISGGQDESKRPNEQQPIQSPSSVRIKLVPIIIDFPQMLSIDHPDAETYFDRDVACIKRFFERRFRFVSDETGPTFEDAKRAATAAVRTDENGAVVGGMKRLDIEAEASGFSRKMAKELEGYMKDVGAEGVGKEGQGEGQEGDEREDEEDEENEEGDDNDDELEMEDEGNGDDVR